MSIRVLNQHAEVINKTAALHVSINAAKGMQDVLKSNLGPKGTIKMLVGGAGDIKLTKDGNTLLKEMQIQNPTAIMIARTAVAQDDISGDGTTSTVIFIGELMKQSERCIDEGMHPCVLVDGFDIAKKATLQFLENFKTPVVMGEEADTEVLKMVARTTLRTKLYEALADQLTDIVVNAVLSIRKPDEAIDLFMVEIMHMRHKFDVDTRLVEGLVLDHGSRHPDMKCRAEDCYILTCNGSLEYDKSEINAGFFYSNAEQREAMVAAERRQVDERVKNITELKNKVCAGTEKNFVVINQHGIDPPSLDLLARAGEKKEDEKKSRGEDERREAAIASAAPLQPTFKPFGVSHRQISMFQELHKRRLLIKKQSKKCDKSQEKKGKCPLKTPASRNFFAANFCKSSVDEECVNKTPLHSDNESVHHVSKNQRQKLYWGYHSLSR